MATSLIFLLPKKREEDENKDTTSTRERNEQHQVSELNDVTIYNVFTPAFIHDDTAQLISTTP